MTALRVIPGDCVEALCAMEEASIDAVVTDPPYELGFMGKRWDASGIAYSLDLWREVLRVLKPGGHLCAFGGTRTYHRMACAIEDAGFEIRDSLHWLYGSGFPKSLNLGDGRGTALKPAHEPIVLARKPLTGTVAANVFRYGTGALNVDACRVEGVKRHPGDYIDGGFGVVFDGKPRDRSAFDAAAGRWPPNLLLTHAAECVQVGTRKVKASTDPGVASMAFHGGGSGTLPRRDYADSDGTETVPAWRCAPGCPVAILDEQSGELTSGARDGQPRRNAVFMREIAGGFCGSDSGGASRFFPVFQYVAKPCRAERDAGLDDLPERSGGAATDREDGSDGLKSPRAGAGRNGGARNHHPTVKPIALMEWLVRLVTPPGGTVLDPFLGSGTTGCAAVRQGFAFVGIEREAEYVEIAKRRIALALNAPRSKPLGSLERSEDADPGQMSLLDVAGKVA